MMKTDRELLELAAKAAGVELDYTIRPDGKAFYHSQRNAMARADFGWFAPLTDDGDALRLACALEMELIVGNKTTAAVKHGVAFAREMHGADKYAATRRAIVRAAAAIGEQMQEPAR